MSDEKLDSAEFVEEETQQTSEGKKRITWVAKDLKSMLNFVGAIYNSLGHTGYHQNKVIAAIHGLSPDSIKQHLSAAQQYKLLELKHRVGYRVTEHFQKLWLPRTPEEKRSAVVESLKNPETYQQLFKDYEFHIVPQEGVKNHFIRSFGMNSDLAAKAGSIFIENLKEFGLLDSRGVLISAVPLKPTIQEIKAESEEEKSEVETNNIESPKQSQEDLPARTNGFVIFQSELEKSGKKTVPIYLIDNKQAVFIYPDDITEDDITLVKHQIEGILLKIKLETQKKQNNVPDEKK